MASIASSLAIGNTPVLLQKPNAIPNKLSSGFSKRLSSSKLVNRRSSTTVNAKAAAQPSSTAVAPTGDRHVAWSSVKQERWQGELVVEGEIPKWLVINSRLVVGF